MTNPIITIVLGVLIVFFGIFVPFVFSLLLVDIFKLPVVTVRGLTLLIIAFEIAALWLLTWKEYRK